MRFRGWLYGLAMKKCGKDFQVTHDAIIRDVRNISVGRNCYVGNHSVLMGSGHIVLGDEVIIAPHVVIISGNHSLQHGSFRHGSADSGVIEIGSGSWVASNSTIQRNSKLPKSSVLSANSFLNKIYEEPYSLYGGVPAKYIKMLKDND